MGRIGCLALLLVTACAPGMEQRSRSAGVSAAKFKSITNVQEQGVDEGDIVKAHGDHLVVLRRGRLFTVKVGGDVLEPGDAIAISPRKNHAAWYDEMLVHQDSVLVIGYSYRERATEVVAFSVGDDGSLARKGRFFLRSDDYFSSRNYASRLIGDELIFYMPYNYRTDGTTPKPAIKHTLGDEGWSPILADGEIIHADEPNEWYVLHSVIRCNLVHSTCTATGILGFAGRNFYVANDAVYVWTRDFGYEAGPNYHRTHAPAYVYRLPLTGGEIGALETKGMPTDQFSFKEDADGQLNVVVRSVHGGDAMWDPEFAEGSVGLLRIDADAWDDDKAATKTAFTLLPTPTDRYASFQNRFVGDTLLYGTGTGWRLPEERGDAVLYAHAYKKPNAPTRRVPLPHGVDRIEVLGDHALVVGSRKADLYFSSVLLGATPSVAGRFVARDRSQGELRSHGFFFRPTSPDTGVLGLPLRQRSGGGWRHLFERSSSVLYLGVNGLALRSLGTLEATPTGRRRRKDGCQVSCIDWYGNSRPIFYDGRIFALMGYEIVEGALTGDHIQERRRADLLPLARETSG